MTVALSLISLLLQTHCVDCHRCFCLINSIIFGHTNSSDSGSKFESLKHDCVLYMQMYSRYMIILYF